MQLAEHELAQVAQHRAHLVRGRVRGRGRGRGRIGVRVRARVRVGVPTR